SISVERDQDPEAAILLPKEKETSARLDETVNIEVEARDPDFALSAVRLHGEVGKGEVEKREGLNEALLGGEDKGRFAGRYSLILAKHDLHAGDLLEYWVEALDNRTPKPNTVTTEHKTIRITSPNAQQPPANQIAQNDRQQHSKDGEKGRGGEG